MTDREMLLKFALFLRDNNLDPSGDSVEAFIEDEGSDPDDDDFDDDDLDDDDDDDDESNNRTNYEDDDD